MDEQVLCHFSFFNYYSTRLQIYNHESAKQEPPGNKKEAVMCSGNFQCWAWQRLECHLGLPKPTSNWYYVKQLSQREINQSCTRIIKHGGCIFEFIEQKFLSTHSNQEIHVSIVWFFKSKYITKRTEFFEMKKINNFPWQDANRHQSCVAAPWLSSANLMPTRIECFRNFSAHFRTQVSSCFCRDLCLNVSTQSLKHLSTNELYILKLHKP